MIDWSIGLAAFFHIPDDRRQDLIEHSVGDHWLGQAGFFGLALGGYARNIKNQRPLKSASLTPVYCCAWRVTLELCPPPFSLGCRVSRDPCNLLELSPREPDALSQEAHDPAGPHRGPWFS